MKCFRLIITVIMLIITTNAYLITSYSYDTSNKANLTEEETAYLKSLGTVKMCVDPDWYPYEQIDANGKYKGIAADLIELVAERTGIKIELVPTQSWDQSIEYSKSQKCDILSFLNETDDRKEWLLFTAPYFEDPNVLITREEHDYISDVARLSGETAVLPEGTSIEERMRRDYPNINLIIVETEAQAIEYVSKREADFTVRSQAMAAYTIRKEGLFNLKIAGQVPAYTNYLRIGVSQDQPLLCQILNKGIQSLTPEDVQSAINNHISVKIQKGFDYKLFFIVFGIFTVIVVLGILWNYQLRALNRRLKVQKAELLQIGEKLAKSEALYKSILRASPDAVLVFNSEGNIVEVSSMAYPLLGYDKDNEVLIGKNAIDFVIKDDVKRLKLNMEALLAGRKAGKTEYEGLRKDARTFIMEVTSEVISGLEDDPKQIISIVRDITAQRKIEKDLRNSETNLKKLTNELENQNLLLNEKVIVDELTGIRNRYYFDQCISKEFNISNHYGSPTSILIFDLDNFKNVNDTYGHNAGDQVLIRICSHVQDIVREIDVFARWGGEEFVILMREMNIENAAKTGEIIRGTIEDIIHPGIGTVTVSIGIAEHIKGEDIESWFMRADAELYRAKKEGRNRVCFSNSV